MRRENSAMQISLETQNKAQILMIAWAIADAI